MVFLPFGTMTSITFRSSYGSASRSMISMAPSGQWPIHAPSPSQNKSLINLAFLLNIRAVEWLKKGVKDEAITDFTIARRVRLVVIRYATALLDSMEDVATLYWVIATLYEASIGIDDEAAAAIWEGKAKDMKVADWMQETRINQAEKLKKMMQDYKELLS